MADDFVQVAPDSTGKKIDNTTETTAAGTVERQRVSIAAVGSNNQLTIDGSGKIGINNLPASQPVTAVDGGIVVEGATTDAAVVTDVNGTLSAKLRGLVKILADVWDSVNHRLKVDGSGVTQPVSGTFWQATQPVSGTVTANQGTAVAASGAWPTKMTDGTNVAAVKAASTAAAATDPAIVVAQSPNSALPTGANVIGALTANQSVNVAQVAGSATGTAAAGIQKIGVVGNAGAIFDAATGAAVPANGILLGGRAATANPANATGGNLTGLMLDHAGRLVVSLGHARELVGVQQTNVAVATETTIVTAGAAGVFNDLIGLIITTAGLAAQTITIKDATGGTTRFIFNYPNAAVAPGSPFIFMPSFAIPQAAAAANWTVTQSAATACNYTAIFLKNT